MSRELIDDIEDAVRTLINEAVEPIEAMAFHPLVVRYHPGLMLMRYMQNRNQRSAPGPVHNNYGSIPR